MSLSTIRQTEQITWVSAEHLPDVDQTVQVRQKLGHVGGGGCALVVSAHGFLLVERFARVGGLESGGLSYLAG